MKKKIYKGSNSGSPIMFWAEPKLLRKIKRLQKVKSLNRSQALRLMVISFKE